MNTSHDIAIVGMGTMGSAAAFHLAKRGHKVIGFEQFRVVHELGSHSGRTRIIRHAYYESPEYVPLILRSHQLWLELQKASGCLLMVQTGGIDVGPEDGPLYSGAILSCQRHKLPYSSLNASELMKLWPQFSIPENWKACFNEQAGFLIVDPCINAHAGGAEAFGATIYEDEKVLEISNQPSSVFLRTDKDTYEVDRVILCAGAWTLKLLNDLGIPLTVSRQPFSWLHPKNPELFASQNFPVFLADTPEGIFYGLPIHHAPAVKVALHPGGQQTDPDQVDRTFHDADSLPVQNFTRQYLPELNRQMIEGQVCLYTITPDQHFIVDFHPIHKNVLIAAGFSGHGFKFAPVIGEILADLASEGMTRHPIKLFQISRFL